MEITDVELDLLRTMDNTLPDRPEGSPFVNVSSSDSGRQVITDRRFELSVSARVNETEERMLERAIRGRSRRTTQDFSSFGAQNISQRVKHDVRVQEAVQRFLTEITGIKDPGAFEHLDEEGRRVYS